jgi:hypothetical protein
MIGLFDTINNATPLSPEARNGLIPTHVTLRSELNELEQKNIGQADGWAFFANEMYSTKTFLRACIKGCLKTYGDGRETIARPKRILGYCRTSSNLVFIRLSVTCGLRFNTKALSPMS